MEAVEDPQVKLVLEKQKCDKIKLKMKKLLLQLDGEKNGYVKLDVLQSVLSLHKVNLSQPSLNALKRECSVPGKPNMISYREAMQRLSLNFEVDEPLMKEWVVRVDRVANAYTALPSTMKSMSQTRNNMAIQTQKQLRKFNTRSALKTINTAQ